MLALIVWAGLAIGLARAQQDVSTANVLGVKLVPVTEPQPAWQLAAEFEVSIGKRLANALDRGLPLVFSVDFLLTKPRWYWADAEIVRDAYPIELSYHALTRSYRVEKAGVVDNYSTYDEAMRAITSIRDWQAIPQSVIEKGESYQAFLRFRLDVTQLPKPFQINAFVDERWVLSSDWLEFSFTPKETGLQ